MGYHNVEEEKDNPFKDNPRLVPIPVLASFSTEGSMIPIYFSVEGIRLKIDKIIWAKEKAAWGSQYRCLVSSDDFTEEIDLIYFKNFNRWVLNKRNKR